MLKHEWIGHVFLYLLPGVWFAYTMLLFLFLGPVSLGILLIAVGVDFLTGCMTLYFAWVGLKLLKNFSSERD